jgi:hypothetical protein
MQILGLDVGEVTPKLKLRLKFYCSRTWYFSFFFVCSFFPVDFFCLFVCFVIVGFLVLFLLSSFFFLSILSTLPSLSSHPYSPPLHFPSFSCAKIHWSPPQWRRPLLTHSNPPALTFPSHYLQPVTRLPSLLHTHRLLTNLLCQLDTTPNPCNL